MHSPNILRTSGRWVKVKWGAGGSAIGSQCHLIDILSFGLGGSYWSTKTIPPSHQKGARQMPR